LGNFNDSAGNFVLLVLAKPHNQILKMPHRHAPCVNRHRKIVPMAKHKLAQILPRNAHDIRDVGKTDQIRNGFN